MKVFKGILLLTALIAISNETSAQQKKLTAQQKTDMIIALGKQKQILTNAGLGQTVTPAMARDYQKQEKIIEQYNTPEAKQLVANNRNELTKRVKNIEQSLNKIEAINKEEAIKTQTTTPIIEEEEEIVFLPPLKTKEEKLAELMYDKKSNKFNEENLKKYITDMQKEYGYLSTAQLKEIIIKDISTGIEKIRKEKSLNAKLKEELTSIVNENLKAISSVPTKTGTEQEESVIVTQKTPEQQPVDLLSPQAMAILELQNTMYKNWDQFIQDTQRSIIAFVDNDTLNPNWFDLAVNIVGRFYQNDEKTQKEVLFDAASSIYSNSRKIKKLDYTNTERDKVKKEVEDAFGRKKKLL